jgi:cytochrome c biogenesis protein CcdA
VFISFLLVAFGLSIFFRINLPTPGQVLGFSGTRGFPGNVLPHSLILGFLSLSCSLPFLVGAMLNIIAGIDVYFMLLRLIAFAAGFACPLAALTCATGAGLRLSALKLSRFSGIMSAVGGASMIAASLLVLMTL